MTLDQQANTKYPTDRVSITLNLSLWLVQGLLTLTLVGGAIWKVAMPVEQLAQSMPWMGQMPERFLQLTALVDFLCGIGVLLPSVTRISPQLTPLAALGGIALMVAAILFHLSRGEGHDTPFNIFLIAMLAFVYWGRKVRAPITPRSATRSSHKP